LIEKGGFSKIRNYGLEWQRLHAICSPALKETLRPEIEKERVCATFESDDPSKVLP